MCWESFAGSKVKLCGLIMVAGVGAVCRQVGSIGKNAKESKLHLFFLKL